MFGAFSLWSGIPESFSAFITTNFLPLRWQWDFWKCTPTATDPELCIHTSADGSSYSCTSMHTPRAPRPTNNHWLEPTVFVFKQLNHSLFFVTPFFLSLHICPVFTSVVPKVVSARFPGHLPSKNWLDSDLLSFSLHAFGLRPWVPVSCWVPRCISLYAAHQRLIPNFSLMQFPNPAWVTALEHCICLGSLPQPF